MSLTEQTHDKHQTKQPQRPTKQESPPLLLPLEVGGSPGGSCRWHRGRRRRRRRNRRRCQTRSRPWPPPGRRSDYISLKYLSGVLFLYILPQSLADSSTPCWGWNGKLILPDPINSTQEKYCFTTLIPEKVRFSTVQQLNCFHLERLSHTTKDTGSSVWAYLATRHDRLNLVEQNKQECIRYNI